MDAKEKIKLFDSISDYCIFIVPVIIVLGCVLGLMQVWDIIVMEDDISANVYQTMLLIVTVATTTSVTFVVIAMHYKKKIFLKELEDEKDEE